MSFQQAILVAILAVALIAVAHIAILIVRFLCACCLGSVRYIWVCIAVRCHTHWLAGVGDIHLVGALYAVCLDCWCCVSFRLVDMTQPLLVSCCFSMV